MFDEDFIDFVTELFPSISPYTQAQTKTSLSQFYKNGKTFECFNAVKLNGICQGDIIDNITFFKISEDGKLNKYTGQGIILSNSCDIENDDYILIAPFYPINSTGFKEEKIKDLKNNRIYGLMYFPDVSEESVFVDFSQIQSFPKTYIKDGIKNKKLFHKHSLNLVGYYLLLCKLTIHFMRPEDSNLQKDREHIEFVQ